MTNRELISALLNLHAKCDNSQHKLILSAAASALVDEVVAGLFIEYITPFMRTMIDALDRKLDGDSFRYN